MNEPDPQLAAGVRRTVGIAALRQLRRLVDAEHAQEHTNARWARRLGIAFLVAATLVLVWLARRIT